MLICFICRFAPTRQRLIDVDTSTALTTSLLAATRGSQLKSRKETMRKLLTFCLLAFLTFGIAPAAFSQATVAPFTTAQVQFFDNSGNACASCQLQTFAAGTTTPLASYSDPGVTLNANPIILDSAGVATIFLTSASYKFVLKGSVASGGATIRTVDNITWATPLSTFNGITSTGNVIVQTATAATNVANQSSPTLCIDGFYFNVTSLTDQWCLSDVLGAGASPTSTLTLSHSGSGGAITLSLPPVTFNSPTFSGTATAANITASGTLGVTGTSTLGAVNAGATSVTSLVNTGDVSLSTGKVIKWNSDVGISRTSNAELSLGNGTQGDVTGTLKANIIVASQSGTQATAAIQSKSTAPFLEWNQTAGLPDTHLWDCGSPSTGVFACRSGNDPGNTQVNWVTVNRSAGAAIGTITFGAGGFVQTLPQATGTLARTSGDTFTTTTLTAPMITNPSATGLTANRVAVASDFTTANNTSLQNITGLSWTFPATAATYSFHCAGTYSQATANVAVNFGIQAVTNNPTNIMANGQQQLTVGTPATFATGTGVTNLATTAATAIVAGVPGATATGYTFYLDGTLELAASANTVNIMVSTAAGADAVTIKRGSYCNLF